MRRGIQLLFTLLLGVGVADSASALTFNLDVEQIGREMVGGEDVITFAARFSPSDASQPITGYDLTVAWDTNEVTLNSFTDLFGGLGPEPDSNQPGGTRTSRIDFSGKTAGNLFQISFVVEPTAVIDGVFDDFRVFVDAGPNGSGIGSPPTFSHDISNPEGFGFDVGASVVPEPSTLALLGATLLPFALRRRR